MITKNGSYIQLPKQSIEFNRKTPNAKQDVRYPCKTLKPRKTYYARYRPIL